MKKINTLWKIYFWIVVLLSGLGHLKIPLNRYWEVGGLVSTVTALVGLFGFCWRKRVLSQIFWKIGFFLVVAFDLIYSYLIPLPSSIAALGKTGVTIGVLICLPNYIALYLYAFKDSLWNEKKTGQFAQKLF